MTDNVKIDTGAEQASPAPLNAPAKDEALLKQQQLQELKGKLDTMIDVMARNPSFLSRASTYWGEIPLWQKIVLGIVLVVPAMVISFVFQLVILFTISTFVLIIYTASSLLLDEHHTQSLDRTASLKTGISSLADMLGKVILSFTKIREDLVVEVERFEKENTALKQQVAQLETQVTEISKKREALEGVVNSLQNTADALGQEKERALKTIQQQSKLLESNQEQLKQARLSLEKTQEELGQKITWLATTNKGLVTELTQAKEATKVLKNATAKLSAIIGLTPVQLEGLKTKITDLINDKEATFLQIAQELATTGRQFTMTQQGMQEAIQQMERQIKESEDLNARLEQLTNPPAGSPAVLMAQLGFHQSNVGDDAKPQGSSQLSHAM